MTKLEVQTLIQAPSEVCFDLARDVCVHEQTTAWTGERVVSQHASPLLDLGDQVTFEARHFGIRWRLTAAITDLDRPNRFVDVMVSGPFRRLRHEHFFEPADGATLMTDLLEFELPIWFLGTLAERAFVSRYMTRFLARRGEALKDIAEAAGSSECATI